jgi:hypothetical protein
LGVVVIVFVLVLREVSTGVASFPLGLEFDGLEVGPSPVGDVVRPEVLFAGDVKFVPKEGDILAQFDAIRTQVLQWI